MCVCVLFSCVHVSVNIHEPRGITNSTHTLKHLNKTLAVKSKFASDSRHVCLSKGSWVKAGGTCACGGGVALRH